ncbi:MAG: hypothetical protein M1837_000275 [Sclerophora amabilis]|nr:MAG: hypothetical protein M1837_000275 [Sclerophora amabilis]
MAWFLGALSVNPQLMESSSISTKAVILGKLTGQIRLPPTGLASEYQSLHNVVEQTVLAGEGNSILVIGARGTGKTTLVESVVSDLLPDYRDDFVVVRLNGFIHSDDKLALREIWRQLGKDLDTEEDTTGKASNYADTLSSLLALLSHPSELSAESTDQASKSVVIILEEFDLFASHPRQTLLYNLFDIAQARKAPIAVIGVTTKINIVESLEKRVKSRFSHRYIHVPLPRSFSSFWEICKKGITVGSTEKIGADGGTSGEQVRNGHLDWNSHVEGLWENDSVFRTLVESIYYKNKSVKDFFAACLVPMAALQSEYSDFNGSAIAQNLLASPESKLFILEGLSELEISLLISAARLDIIFDTDTCNFNMAYEEYTSLASRVKMQSSASGAAAVGTGAKIWGPEVSLGAWEKLADYGLIVPAIGALTTSGGATGHGGGSGSKDVDRAGRMYRVDIGIEEILPSVPNMNTAMAKWCRSI